MGCLRIFFVSSIGQKNSRKLIDFQIIRVVLRKLRTQHTEFMFADVGNDFFDLKARKPAHTSRRRRLKHALNKITRRITPEFSLDYGGRPCQMVQTVGSLYEKTYSKLRTNMDFGLRVSWGTDVGLRHQPE